MRRLEQGCVKMSDDNFSLHNKNYIEKSKLCYLAMLKRVWEYEQITYLKYNNWLYFLSIDILAQDIKYLVILQRFLTKKL